MSKNKKHKRFTIRTVKTIGAFMALSLFLIIVTVFLQKILFINQNSPDKIDRPEIIDYKFETAPDNPFLHSEEAVIIETGTSTTPEMLPIDKVLFEYVEVTDGCGPHFEGECLLVRSGPGQEYPIVERLRNGVVLKVGGKVEHDNITWFKIVFDEWLRYPERVKGDWYVASDYVDVLLDEGSKTVWDKGKVEQEANSTSTEPVTSSTSTEKIIVVDRSDQTLTAYEGYYIFMETKISTGLELTPTPRGEFTIFKKTPSRYMQGPLPYLRDQQYYDLPGVPWNLYFTEGGAVIHGAYWHNSFGSAYSHGCVNMRPNEARNLYNWATLGTKVIVKD
ncbi:MAG: L,D-transpeptidase family protein [Candidatus Paceibacterota bacterium]